MLETRGVENFERDFLDLDRRRAADRNFVDEMVRGPSKRVRDAPFELRRRRGATPWAGRHAAIARPDRTGRRRSILGAGLLQAISEVTLGIDGIIA